MKKQFVTLALLAALTACGGGDGAAQTAPVSGADTAGATPVTAAAVVDKYVGTWSGCFAQGTGSHRETVIPTRTGDSSASYTYSEVDYASTDCSGSPSASFSGTGSLVLTGTATVGADTVDKGFMGPGVPPTAKEIFLVKDTGVAVTFAIGRRSTEGGAVDSDGYPTTLNRALTKQ